MSKPDNFPWLSPYVIVTDVERSIAFYKDAFGFELLGEIAIHDNVAVHAELTYKNCMVMIGKEGAGDFITKTPKSSGVDSPVSMYVYCENVDGLFDRAQKANAQVIDPPKDMFWGDRMCTVADLDGHKWNFATKI